MKVTVVIPVYNSMPYIDRAVNSVLASQGVEVELILVDDCSTDGSWEYIQKWKDKAILLKNERNHGSSNHSFNVGIRNSTAEWISFLDHDDMISPRKLEMQLDVSVNQGVDIISCNQANNIGGSVYWDTDRHSPWYARDEMFQLFLSLKKNPCVQSFLVRKSICPMFEEKPGITDHGWMLDLFHNREVFVIEQFLLTRYVHEDSLGHSIKYREATLKLREEYYSVLKKDYPRECKIGSQWHHGSIARFYYKNNPKRCRELLLHAKLTYKNVWLYFSSFSPKMITWTLKKFNL